MTIHVVVPEATRHRLFAKRRTQAIERGTARGINDVGYGRLSSLYSCAMCGH